MELKTKFKINLAYGIITHGIPSVGNHAEN